MPKKKCGSFNSFSSAILRVLWRLFAAEIREVHQRKIVFRKWLFEQWIEQKRRVRFCSMESDCELASVVVSRELARMLGCATSEP